jgi:hypothetical protein
VACTTIECGDGGSQTDGAADAVLTPACMFDDTYKFGSDGGFVAYLDEATLAPPDHYRHVRTRFGGSAPAESTCAPALPACGTANVITARDVVRDLANADVRAAFAQATPPFFGVDTRPVDGVAFKVTRADGHGFFVGNPCGPPAVDCRAIPPGVQTLVDLLKALDQQQLANAECAAVTKP